MTILHQDTPQVICIGSALWDIIGRSSHEMFLGSDVPGRIARIPGGVALNVAMTLSQFGYAPTLLSAVGRDKNGDELLSFAQSQSIDTDHVIRHPKFPTDSYMGIETPDGLIAAIADAHSLEQVGADILNPLINGLLGSAERPCSSIIALDGNLTENVLEYISKAPEFLNADLRVIPASPGKVQRLKPLLKMPNSCLYVNLEEANILCSSSARTAEEAANTLHAQGISRAIITNGSSACAEVFQGNIITSHPPKVSTQRVTGAGDTFIAAHISAQHQNMSQNEALDYASTCAARYVSGVSPI